MNLNKNIIRFLILASALFIVPSCKKYLEKKPLDTTPESTVFTTLAGMETALIGVYAQLAAAYPNDIYATALVTDEAWLPTENNTGRGVIPYRWQFDAATGEVTAAWNAYYITINRANKLLTNAANVPVNDAAETLLRDQYRGEALAIRAFSHMQLLKNYAASFDAAALGITYMEVSEIGKPSRNTVAQVFAKLKADLATAKGLIPSTYTKNTRVTRAAVTALQAQVALYEKDWDAAIAASSEVITAFPLATRAQFLLVWKDQSNAEVIWKLKRNAGEARIGDTYFDRAQSKIVYGPSKELRDTYDAVNDVRYEAYVLNLGSGRFALNKYRGGDAANVNLADLKVFRTAEMYLIRAEAYAQKNDLVKAAADVNTLRAARITGYVPQTFATKDDAINAILMERFKELAFEAHRYYDLKRNRLPITRIAEDAINALGAVLLTPDKKEYLFPIPLTEIQANENMQQNTGF